MIILIKLTKQLTINGIYLLLVFLDLRVKC